MGRRAGFTECGVFSIPALVSYYNFNVTQSFLYIAGETTCTDNKKWFATQHEPLKYGPKRVALSLSLSHRHTHTNTSHTQPGLVGNSSKWIYWFLSNIRFIADLPDLEKARGWKLQIALFYCSTNMMEMKTLTFGKCITWLYKDSQVVCVHIWLVNLIWLVLFVRPFPNMNMMCRWKVLVGRFVWFQNSKFVSNTHNLKFGYFSQILGARI